MVKKKFFFPSADLHTKQKMKKSAANLKTLSVRGHQSYRSCSVKWLTLENKKKTAISQDWRHKKEKTSYQSFSLMVSYQKM